MSAGTASGRQPVSVRTGLLLLSGLLCGFLAAHAWRMHGRPAIVTTPTPTAPTPAEGARTGQATPRAARREPSSPAARPPLPRDMQGPARPDAVAAAAVDAPSLLVPVQGVAPDALSDTFDDARGDERRHEALDIMAPAGTPVLAVADGHIEKLFDSKQGGLTIYQFEPAGRLAYYYAHLERYAPGLREKQAVRRGEVIGYVGSTGNADPAAPHLHFAVFALGPEKRWWKGTPVNPYPLLRAD